MRSPPQCGARSPSLSSVADGMLMPMAKQPGTPGGSDERPAVFFRDAGEFRAWLEANHETSTELWMGLTAKHVEPRGLTWAQAVPEALCFGWIDSLSQRIDDDARRQRWTPRKATSNWSAVNVAHVERLQAKGRMHPAGLAAYEARRDDRTAIYSCLPSCSSPSMSLQPPPRSSRRRRPVTARRRSPGCSALSARRRESSERDSSPTTPRPGA